MYYTSIDQLEVRRSVISIGAFDGVHIGHQKVIAENVAYAAMHRAKSIAYTFDPPPRAYFTGARVLTSVDEKVKKLKELGVDHVIVIPFNEQFMKISTEQFIAQLQQLQPLKITVGEDFKFGNGRRGDIQLLKRHFHVESLPLVCCERGEKISSTRIRNMLANGDMSCFKYMKNTFSGGYKNESTI